MSAEAAWFVLWVFTPALVRPAAPPEEAVDIDTPCTAIPQPEGLLTVALRDGRKIVLERERLAQSVFAAADPELITVVFGERRNLELLRRAIWLGACRGGSYDLAELDNLIDDAEETEALIGACYQEPRERFAERIKLWFCGDAA